MKLRRVQKILMIVWVVHLYPFMQAAENLITDKSAMLLSQTDRALSENVGSIKDQIIAVLKESLDFKEVAALYNYDINWLLNFHINAIYDDHDDIGVALDKIHAQLLKYHINRPLGEILFQVLNHNDKAIIFQQGRYEVVGGLPSSNSYDSQILNFVAEHPNYYFDIAPVVRNILNLRNYKASVIDFINRHIKIIPQIIPNLQNMLLFFHNDSQLIEQCFCNMPEALSSVQFLINLGADVNFKSRTYGKTPLMEACCNESKDSYKLVILLVNYGADVNASSALGETPLMYACSQGSLDKVHYLLSKGAQINCISKIKLTPLLKACQNRSEDSLSIIELLVDHGADINDQRLSHEWTPLIYACYQGSLAAVQCLLSKGVEVNSVTTTHETALMIACENRSENSLPIMELLIDHGADVNAQKSDGMTPLMIACSRHLGDKSLDRVLLLVKKGANVHHIDHQGHSALKYAQDNQYIVDFLLGQGLKR